MAKSTTAAIATAELMALADRAYFNGEEFLACPGARISTLVPPTKTSNAKADWRFNKRLARWRSTRPWFGKMALYTSIDSSLRRSAPAPLR